MNPEDINQVLHSVEAKKEMTSENMLALAEELEKADATINKGRGLRFVQSICISLRRATLESLREARAIYLTDGDKLNQYLGSPEGEQLQTLLDQKLGNPINNPSLLE